MAERDLNDPAVKQIIEFGNHIFNKGPHLGPLISDREDFTVISYEIGERFRSERIVVGVVTPDGEPYVSLVPLAMIPDAEKAKEAIAKAKVAFPNMFGSDKTRLNITDPQVNPDYLRDA